jgi:hypothetical protein
MRSVWKSDLPPAGRVVTKNVRGQNEALDGPEGRERIDIAGAKALHFYWGAGGTTEQAAEKRLIPARFHLGAVFFAVCGPFCRRLLVSFCPWKPFYRPPGTLRP